MAGGVLLFSAGRALAGTATLAWDPVPDTDVTGYKIYYGTSSGTYPNVVDAGNVTTYSLTTLTDCTLYYFAVKAYDQAGNISVAYSNEISGYPKPTVTAVSPASGLQNAGGLALTLTGANFRTGATAIFSGTGITVNSVSVASCTSLTANVSIALTAATGLRDVTVKNPDLTAGTGTGLFTVNAADVASPVISAVASSRVSTTGATVTWTTNEASTTQLAYMPEGSTTYTSTPLSPALVTSHSVTLTGLTGGTTYQYHAMSTDASGNTATSTPDATFTTQAYDTVTFEAESGTLKSPMASQNDFDTPEAFGGYYIWTPPGSGTNYNGNPVAKATYRVTLAHTASYVLWVRLYAPAINYDSFWQSLDGGSVTALTAASVGNWVWTQGATYPVTAGTHTLVLGLRDEQARADRIILTDDPDFVPTAAPVDNTPAVLSAVTACCLTTSNATITWTTSEPADGQVQFGTTTAYGSATTVDPTMVVSHNVLLLGLQSATVYHYRVISTDRGGNVTQSQDFTFSTATPGTTPPPSDVKNVKRNDNHPH